MCEKDNKFTISTPCGIVRVRRSVKSSAHGRRWLTQAKLTRSEIFETSMSWAESILESRAAVSERKVS